MKKFIALLLVVVLTATVAVGGTLAYLTDRDSKVNTFTVGDVSIQLNEEFEQGSALVPGVDINKDASITNTGKNAAWVWATVAIPAALDDDNDASQNIVHFNYDRNNVGDGQWTWTDSEGNWRIGTVTLDGVNYNLYSVLHQTPVAPGETTPDFLDKVYLDPHVDIDPDGDWYWVENGSTTAINWNSTENGRPNIYVSAYAIQAEGFTNVEDAYNAYQTQWGKNGAEYAEPTLAEDVKVTAADLASIDFTKNNTRFVLSGEFTEDLSFQIPEGLNQIYDASGANFVGNTTVTIKAPGVAHAYSSLNADRKGNVTVTGFEVETLNVLAYNNESVVISNNKVNSMSVIGGNFDLTIKGNQVDGNFGTYTDGEGQSNDYGISLRITDYELSIVNNQITDCYSHAIGINGRQGEASSDWGACGKNNKIVSFSGNNITVNSTKKTERAALKIWCDQVYAPYATSGQTPTAAATALMASIKADTSNVFTLGSGHTAFNIFDWKA